MTRGGGLVLSLFPGADLFGMAFEKEGFCVVHAPDILMGGDVKNFHAIAGKFDGVIGGPPCQLFSRASRLAGTGAVNLIPEFERIVREAQPEWFLMENVPDAPPAAGSKWNAVLDAANYGNLSRRKRRFSSNLLLMPVPEARHEFVLPTITASEHKCSMSNGHRKACAGAKLGRRLTMEEMNEGMGLPRDFSTPALTVAMGYRVRGNGVPIPMGLALARAVKNCLT